MLVRHIETQQLGNIPDDKFDPSLFEAVQPGVPQVTPTTEPISNGLDEAPQCQIVVRGRHQPLI